MGRSRLLVKVILVYGAWIAFGWAKELPTGPFIQTDCLQCHEKQHPEIVTDWRASPHAAMMPPVDCVACHGNQHGGSAATARHNTTCITCHDEADGEAIQSYRLSKHGIITTLEAKQWDWSLPLADGNYRAPTCAYCHMHGGDHAMGGEKEVVADPLRDPGVEEAVAALERRVSSCYDCHSPRFATTWFRSGERMVAVGRMKVREGAAVAEKIFQFERRKAVEKASNILANMMEKHLRNVQLGVFHQSPDHQWWHGQPALDGDLLRLKGILSDLSRQR